MRQAGALFGRPQVLTQGGDQAEIVQHRRPQLERQLAHLVECLRCQIAQVRDQLARLDRQVGSVRVGHAAQAALEPDDQRRQRLAGLVVQFASNAAALLLLRPDDLGRESLRLIGLVADRARVGLESVPQRVHLEDQRRDVGVGERGQRGARGMIASVEASDHVAQRTDGPERLAQQQHGQRSRERQRHEHQERVGDRRKRPAQDEALGEPGPEQRAAQDDHDVDAQQPPEQRQRRPGAEFGGLGARCEHYQRNSTVPDGLGGLAPAASVDACGSCAASHV